MFAKHNGNAQNVVTFVRSPSSLTSSSQSSTSQPSTSLSPTPESTTPFTPTKWAIATTTAVSGRNIVIDAKDDEYLYIDWSHALYSDVILSCKAQNQH